jgi:hypothetical protein
MAARLSPNSRAGVPAAVEPEIGPARRVVRAETLGAVGRAIVVVVIVVGVVVVAVIPAPAEREYVPEIVVVMETPVV